MSLALKVLIVEDETPAAEKLERYLKKFNQDMEILGIVGTVNEAVEWLQTRQSSVDLIFMDIQLHDGLSFQIFQQVAVRKPVIFITAYDEYALEAFRVNGINYLLKPITYTDLANSLTKLESLRSTLAWDQARSERVAEVLSASTAPALKSRFMVKLGDHIRSVTADQISMFFADGRDVYLVTNQLRKFIIDYTLESLEEVVDSKLFFRVNRSYIINISAIQDVVVYSNSRLKIAVNIKWDNEIIVSREKVGEFKQWFDGH